MSDSVTHTTTRERDNGSINSYDSGFITSPTTSHASQYSNESTCHSNIETACSSKNSIDNESETDTINGNSKFEENGNQPNFKTPEDMAKHNETCTQMALAIYQRLIFEA